jgi:anti-anti-sigma regulatory factor
VAVEAAATTPSFSHPSPQRPVADLIEIEWPSPRAAVVSLVGEHDIASLAALSEALDDLLASRDIVVDLARCTFIELTVVGALIDCAARARERSRHFAVVIPPGRSAPTRLAEMLGLADQLAIYASRECASRDERHGLVAGLELSQRAEKALRRGGPSSSLDVDVWEELGALHVAGRPIARKTRSQDGNYVWTLNAHGRRVRAELGGAKRETRRLVMPRL